MPNRELTILLVEDDRSFKMYAMQALKGHNNIAAGTVSEAMAKFKLNKPDITFLDINLPDGNGLEVLQEMKKLQPDAFIVMMTGSSAKNDVNSAQTHGAAGYILKPFNTQKVKDCIEKFINFKKTMGSLSLEEINLQNANGYAKSRKDAEEAKKN